MLLRQFYHAFLRTTILWIMFSMGFGTFVCAQPVLNMSNIEEILDQKELVSYFEAYQDDSGLLDLKDIKFAAFVPFDEFSSPKGFLRNNHFRIWLHCKTIGTPLSKADLYWFFGKEHSNIIAFMESKKEFYAIARGKDTKGALLPSAYLIPINIWEEKDTINWYFEVQSFPYEAIQLTPQVFSHESWLAKSTQDIYENRWSFNALVGLASLLIFMFVFSLVQFFIHKTKVFAYYSGFLLSVLLNLYRYNLELLVPITPITAFLTMHGNKFSTYFGHFFYIWFVICFLSLPQTSPSLYLWLRRASYLALGAVALHLIFYYGLERHDLASWLYFGLRYVFLGIVTVSLVLITWSKVPYYGFILAGSILVMFGANWWMIWGIRDPKGLMMPPHPNLIFYFSVLIEMIVFISGLGYKFRKTEIEKREAQNKILSERERISRDLHDDIGATLNTLVFQSELAKQYAVSPSPKLLEMLDQIKKIAASGFERMDEIIWSVNPPDDSLEDLTTRMRNFSQQLFADNLVRFRYHVTPNDDQICLSAEQRWNFFLIFKEALNNIRKYASASQVHISIVKNGEILEMKIQDNGNGFDLKKINHGNGHYNMQERAKKLHGHCRIQSTIGEGTEICILVPYNPI